MRSVFYGTCIFWNMKFIFTILVIFLPFLRPTIELTSKYFNEWKVTSNVSILIKFSTEVSIVLVLFNMTF